jgi:hypothetical protein
MEPTAERNGCARVACARSLCVSLQHGAFEHRKIALDICGTQLA